MKLKLWIIQFIIIAVLSGLSYGMYRSNQKLRDENSVAYANLKAYASENSTLKNDKRVFLLTIAQIKEERDSVVNQMYKVAKESKIKDKTIKSLQYRLTTVSKPDTIRLRDTIFSDPEFRMDTTFGDKWLKQNLYMEYPNIIASRPEIILDNYITIHEDKETIKPRKKFFLWRWFQKKHKVLKVDVHENNPYARDSVSRFVEIRK
jgi:hypothetical protein